MKVKGKHWKREKKSLKNLIKWKLKRVLYLMRRRMNYEDV